MATPQYLSVYGMLFLAGAMAASRADDRATTRVFLAEADETAGRVGADANHLWTAFGPTNVTIHRVATAIKHERESVWSARECECRHK